MSTAFGIAPRQNGSKFFEVAPNVVAAIDKTAPFAPKPKFALWSAAEDSVIHELAGQGSGPIHKILPHRSRAAIRQRARYLGIQVKWTHGVGYKMPKRRRAKPIARGSNPLVRHLITELNKRELTWAEAEAKAGVAVGTIRAWKSRSMPRLDNFTAALNAIGLDLKIVRLGSES